VRVTAGTDRTAAAVTTLKVAPDQVFEGPLLNLITGYRGHGMLEPGLTVLAGSPTASEEAPFVEFHGLTHLSHHPDARLEGKWAVLDGVATLAGAEAPGFAAWRSQPPTEQRPERMAGTPCFSRPGGLFVANGRAIIADTWNHAIRILELSTGELSTLAGDREAKGVRPGSLRLDGKPEAATWAAFGLPICVAVSPQGQCLVANASCITELAFDQGAGSGQGGEVKGEVKQERKSPGAGAGRP
jgi:hypothetical protein